MVLATDIKFYYSSGSNPVADSTNPTNKALGAASLGGPPRAAIAANQVPNFTHPTTNLNNLFDDVLETQSSGSGGSDVYKDYRCIYAINEDADPASGDAVADAIKTTCLLYTSDAADE